MVFSVIRKREDQERKKHLGSPPELRGKYCAGSDWSPNSFNKRILK